MMTDAAVLAPSPKVGKNRAIPCMPDGRELGSFATKPLVLTILLRNSTEQKINGSHHEGHEPVVTLSATSLALLYCVYEQKSKTRVFLLWEERQEFCRQPEHHHPHTEERHGDRDFTDRWGVG